PYLLRPCAVAGLEVGRRSVFAWSCPRSRSWNDDAAAEDRLVVRKGFERGKFGFRRRFTRAFPAWHPAALALKDRCIFRPLQSGDGRIDDRHAELFLDFLVEADLHRAAEDECFRAAFLNRLATGG